MILRKDTYDYKCPGSNSFGPIDTDWKYLFKKLALIESSCSSKQLVLTSNSSEDLLNRGRANSC